MNDITYSEAIKALNTTYDAQKVTPPTKSAARQMIGGNAYTSISVRDSSSWAVSLQFTVGCRTIGAYVGSSRQSLPTPASVNIEQKALRAAAYVSRGCSDLDYVDAVTKQSSTDAAIKAVGEEQLTAVLAARLQVKLDFPYVS